jgi:polysaccharide pyruvyl transferase WcaK-like protein
VNVALLTPYDGGNLGDAAIQEALIGNFRIYDPRVHLCGITLHPESTAERHGIPSYPLAAISRPYYHAKTVPAPSVSNYAAASGIGRSVAKPGLFRRLKRALRGLLFRIGFGPSVRLVQEGLHILRSYRLLRGMDMLVVAGGGQLDEEWGGSWAHPYALMKWAVLARAAGSPVIFLSVGGCRAELRLTRLFLRIALSLACYRSYRDEGSRQLALAITRSANGPVQPDLAFSLPVTRQLFTAPSNLAELRVGVSPIAFARPGMWPTEDPAQHQRYMNELALFVVHLIKSGISVTLFSSCSPDDRLFNDLRARIDPSLESGESPRLLFSNTASVQDLLALLHSLDIVVASRLHGLVLSFLAGKPCIALSYDRKVDALMTDVGLTAYCLDIRSFTGEKALATLRNLHANGSLVASKLSAICCDYDQLLQSQYRLVTKLRGSGLSSSPSGRAAVASDEHRYEPRSDARPHG